MKKHYLLPLLLLALFPSKIFSMDRKEASEKYGQYFNDNWKHWMMESNKSFQPRISNLSLYLDTAENWQNNRYWIKRAKDGHDWLCDMYEIQFKTKNSSNDKRLYEQQCLNKSYFNSRITYKLTWEKVNSCNSFRKLDFYNKATTLPSATKKLIFNECGDLYKKYNSDRKNFYTVLDPFYKMFYIHGLTAKEVENEAENFHEKNKKCFISTNYNYKDILNKVSTPDAYNKCMGWKWN